MIQKSKQREGLFKAAVSHCLLQAGLLTFWNVIQACVDEAADETVSCSLW